MKALSPRHQVFVTEYLKHSNAAKAARDAGYSKKTAAEQGHRLLKDPRIAKAVDDARGSYAKQAGLDAVEVLREIRRIAFADPAQLFDKEGKFRPVSELKPDLRRAIASIEVDEHASLEDEDLVHGPRITDDGVDRGGPRIFAVKTVKVKFWDKLKALELAAKHLKLLGETKLDLSGEDGTLNVTINMGSAT